MLLTHFLWDFFFKFEDFITLMMFLLYNWVGVNFWQMVVSIYKVLVGFTTVKSILVLHLLPLLYHCMYLFVPPNSRHDRKFYIKENKISPHFQPKCNQLQQRNFPCLLFNEENFSFWSSSNIILHCCFS